MPGFRDLNIDLLPPVVFITCYTTYTDHEIRQITAVITDMFKSSQVIIQDRSVRPAIIRYKTEDIKEEYIIRERGLQFYTNPMRGQNPGFFTDMRSGRTKIDEIVRKLSAEGKNPVSVLNLFAYTCALSVTAAAAGAAKVVNIDKNGRSLEIGRKNHRLNIEAFPEIIHTDIKYLPHDVMKSMGKLKREGPYNLIIADPPPSQKGSFNLKNDYPRILRRLPELLAPGGCMMLTLNSPSWSWDDFELMIRENLSAAEDHGILQITRLQPPQDFAPAEDGRGLKIICIKSV